MNLPHPFESAQDLKPDAEGRIALIDRSGKVLAHIPLATAYGFVQPHYARPHDSGGFGHYGVTCVEGYGVGTGAYGVSANKGNGAGVTVGFNKGT